MEPLKYSQAPPENVAVHKHESFPKENKTDRSSFAADAQPQRQTDFSGLHRDHSHRALRHRTAKGAHPELVAKSDCTRVLITVERRTKLIGIGSGRFVMIEAENQRGIDKPSGEVEEMNPNYSQSWQANPFPNELPTRIRSQLRVNVDRLRAVGVLLGVMLISAEPINRLKHRLSSFL